MCRKMLVLGSDFGTLQVVREAHRAGAYVIVADLMETSPTKELADESWLISTTDIEMLEEKCRAENITAIMFGASDFNINNARELCKRLNLPIYCEDDYAWKVARDKGEFKRICKKVGAPIAQDYYITDELAPDDLNSVVFPVVVKPVDKSGNRGMSYCNNKTELQIGYKLAREISDKEIIVERRLKGQEYNVHYALADGEARLLYFSSTHHEPGQSENLYSFKCTTSEHLIQYVEEVNEKVKAVIREAKCKDGIVWVDCMRDEDGKFYLLEMGYRFGGVMTYVPYEKVSGFNTVKWMTEYALGIKHCIADLPKELNFAYKGCAASYHLFACQEGTVEHVKGLAEILELDNVYIDMPKREGNLMRKHACMGLIGIYGEDVEIICNTLEKINAVLKIQNKIGQDMIIYFDDYNSLRDEYYAGLEEFYEQDNY